MFVQFLKEENLLNQNTFMKNEVQFNLFHRIIEGELDVCLRTDDNNMIAMNNIGRQILLWINEDVDENEKINILKALVNEVKEKKLIGISSTPDISKLFAEEYSNLTGIGYKFFLGTESYFCPTVMKPQNVPGKMILSQMNHINVIAEFLPGFIYDCFGQSVSVESQMPVAERTIKSGYLFLWEIEDHIVSMASVVHRAPRHARIGYVYTPPEERKKGYASALVAELCNIIKNEGLIPILFADVKNPDSNKVYKNIGFRECGRIDQYNFIYE